MQKSTQCSSLTFCKYSEKNPISNHYEIHKDIVFSDYDYHSQHSNLDYTINMQMTHSVTHKISLGMYKTNLTRIIQKHRAINDSESPHGHVPKTNRKQDAMHMINSYKHNTATGSIYQNYSNPLPSPQTQTCRNKLHFTQQGSGHEAFN